MESFNNVMNHFKLLHKILFAGSSFIVKLNRGNPLIKVGGGYMSFKDYFEYLVKKFKKRYPDNIELISNIEEFSGNLKEFLLMNFKELSKENNQNNKFLVAKVNPNDEVQSNKKKSLLQLNKAKIQFKEIKKH